MATGGSYNPSTFAQKTPFETWAGVQGIGLYWDTENQFAAGKQGVTRASFGGPGAVEGRIRRATPPGGNYLGGYGQRQINIGPRDYGSQAIDRGEIGRIGGLTGEIAGAIGPVVQPLVSNWRQTQAKNKRYRQLQQVETGITNRMSEIETALEPDWMKEARERGPSPLASGDWRTEQEARKQAQGPGAPPQLPLTPDVSAESQTYQRQVAQRRASRQAARASAGDTFGFPPPPGSTKPSPFAPPPPGSKRPAPIGFPAPVVAPSPTSPVGDQSARLMAEGTVAPGGPEMATETETRGVRSLTRPTSRPLTRSLTNTPTGSGGATAQRGVPEGRSTARSPRRKR